MKTAYKTIVVAAAVAFVFSAYAMADSGTGEKADDAFKAAMMKMHQGMMVSYSGNADVDFVESMIPHHQGAIDMAKIELQYGKDPEMKKLAGQIVQARETEIRQMQAWLQQHQ
jgi:uncharacterized protein (DUF305 family)